MTRRTRIRTLAVAAFALRAAVFGAAPALAATTVAIRAGATGDPIGTATLDRTLQGDGSEVVTIRLDLTGSGPTLEEVHVCVGGDPFTGRKPPGRCAFSATGLSGTTFVGDLDLGTAYLGRPVCLQPHLAVLSADGRSTATAYAGWTTGRPFFGSVCLGPDGTEVPAGTAGGLGLALLVAGGLGVALLGSRRAARTRNG